MREKYNFIYTKKQINSIKYYGLIAPLIVVFVIWMSSSIGVPLFQSLTSHFKIDYFPTVYFFVIWEVWSFVPLLCFLIYFLYFNYNTSVTFIHWDFNQEIEITGNELNAILKNGDNQFYETIHINKIKKKKYAIFYYESRHRFVAIPSDVLPIHEGD